ncbi:MAG TPA: lipid A export permease/ATP-binding protein MsbA [Candidatus Thiothrix moscowensis]|uniref:lipid A export permease/ATP-binding protein MsbA n=1 Tax=unclassified Thiothrix TaxID=2636184 RepID=UPI0025D5EE63|nr:MULTISPECIES: lipid A export permease/ATP-binding protein MsbA [unclassified Thiothrix]HRJ53245.1 lipid A export permease/ATP-binding protein MsbA [Candidatus Thiothrix moscowensis]HRJ93185.1 lipid A export permease/ATP-binding protein MsbA [Candidatus Thiothrix moscowensis]
MNIPRTTGLQVYRRLIGYSLTYGHYLLLAIVGLIVSAITQPLFAWILGPLLDKAILQRDQAVIAWLPLGILGIFLLRGAAMFVSGYYIGLVGRQVTKTLRDQVFAHLLRMPVRFFENTSSGKLLAYVSYYIDQVANASIRGITSLVQDSVTIIGLLALMFYQSWQLTLATLVIAPLITVVVVYATRRLRRLSHKVQDSVGQVTQIANEMIRGYKVVRIFNGEQYESQRFSAANEDNINLQMKRMVTELLSTPLVQFMVAVALAAMVYIATRQSTLETLSPGTFMSFIMSMILMLTPIRNLTQLNAQLQTAIAAGEGIFELLDSQTERDNGTQVLQQCRGEVEFRDVAFVYPETDKTVLRNINLKVKPGEKIALVGKSGSGKTTLVNLLPRFHDVQTGEIRLDGVLLQDIRLRDLRSHLAYVGQDIVLFNDSVRNNIAYGDMRGMQEERIRAAAEAAHALEFIEKLPQGFDTLIGDNGVMLSGGQRQRLSIARAILSSAQILILDEATSALDTESERHIQAALDRLLENRTTFMIAHRLSTIENADRILVMQDGEIIESGKHADLLVQNGQYARLHALQFHDEAST